MTKIVATYPSSIVSVEFDLDVICEKNDFETNEIGSYYVHEGALILMLHDGRKITEYGYVEYGFGDVGRSVKAYDDNYNEIEIG